MEAIILPNPVGVSSPETNLPMTPLQGRPFLSYQLEYWGKQGVDRFIIPISASQGFIREYFGKQFRGKEVSYIHLKRDLGDGGALLLALSQAIDDTVLVINGNYFAETDLKALKKAHTSKGAEMTLVVSPKKKKTELGWIEMDKGGRVSKLGGSEYVNMGVALVDKAALSTEIPFERGDALTLEETLFPYLIKKGDALYAHKTNGTAVDISDAAGSKEVEALILSLSPKAA